MKKKIGNNEKKVVVFILLKTKTKNSLNQMDNDKNIV